MAASSPSTSGAVTKSSQSSGEKSRTSRHWRRPFLDTLAETSNVSQAARVARIDPSKAYKARRAEPEFRDEWNSALLEGYEHLEMETLHRLRVGTGKDDNKFDVANALRLLMMHRETAAREKALRSHEDKATVLATLNAKIEAMRSREAEVRQMLQNDLGAQDDGLEDGLHEGL